VVRRCNGRRPVPAALGPFEARACRIPARPCIVTHINTLALATLAVTLAACAGGPSIQQQALNAGISPAATLQCDYEATAATSGGGYRGIAGAIEQGADHNHWLKMCLRAAYAREAPARAESNARNDRILAMITGSGLSSYAQLHCRAILDGTGADDATVTRCLRKSAAAYGETVGPGNHDGHIFALIADSGFSPGARKYCRHALEGTAARDADVMQCLRASADF
jgi:hypothetical protein